MSKHDEIMTEDKRLALQRAEYAKKKAEQVKRAELRQKPKMIKANIGGDHEIIEEEKGFVHVYMSKNHYNSGTNQVNAEQKIVKYYPRIWKAQKDKIQKLFDVVEVIHDPELKTTTEPGQGPKDPDPETTTKKKTK